MTPNEAKLVQFIQECQLFSEQRTRGHHERFLANWKQFRSVLDQPHWTWRSRIFVPKSMALVLNILPRIIGNDPIIGVVGEKGTTRRQARVMEAVIKQQLALMDYFMALYLQTQDGLIYGVGYRQNTWKYEQRIVSRRPNKNEILHASALGLLPEQTVQENVVTFDGPQTTNLDVFDVFPDPTVHDPRNGDFLVIRKELSRWKFDELARLGVFKNASWVTQRPTPGKETESTSEAMKERRDQSVNISTEEKHRPKPLAKIKLLEFQGMVPGELTSSGRPEKRFIIVANGILVRDVPFLFRHDRFNITRCAPIPVNRDHIGLSLLEMVRGLQIWENIIRNAAIDTMTMTQVPMWKRRRGAGIPSWQLRPRPSGIIDMENVESDLQPLVVDSHLSELAGLLTSNEQAWQEAGGAPLPVQGRDAPGINKTAAGVAMLIREATTRIKLMQRITEKTVMLEDGRQFIGLNEQFLSEDQTVRIAGEDMFEEITVSPQEIIGQYGLSPVIFPNEPFFKAIEKENLAFVINVLKSSPGAQGYDFSVLDKRVMESFNMDDIVDEVMSGGQEREELDSGSPIETEEQGKFPGILDEARGLLQTQGGSSIA